ncbi:SusD family protein [Polaribacter sp. KT25b]|uniref:RagB/SusD family nutrient uptake outer membrane protein n=1 Tax=Polaribacter sp. KT25b TaxID=1855336 RepID=UPI00087A3482|nr:RagB/SusD family nutrient uptake outer membrane protein [Polaribacter sp. KT25b]SDS48808.1 SusD family protein [Polaribacter sp. KT25b]
MKKIIYILVFSLSFIACDDYLDIEPTGQIIPKSVNDYRSFLTAAYAITKNSKVLTTYRSDELSLSTSSVGIEQYEDLFIWNDLNPSPLTTAYPYATIYNIIFYTNHVINNADTMIGDTLEKEQLLGEAYALRALQYFDLINLYAKPFNAATASKDAGVPITTVYDSEKEYTRATVQEVYNLILNDLNEAEILINTDTQESGYKYRFSTLAVKAFKARVYLYQKEWEKAITSSSEALSINSGLQNLNSDNSIMPSEYNSVEAILALEKVSSFDITSNASISENLLSIYNQAEDLRFASYFYKDSDGTYHSNKSAETKFKSSFRTAEMYLIQAESYAQLNASTEAKEKLLELAVNRYTSDGMAAYTLKVNALNAGDLLTEILEERRREFAIEGHRWNDLRRTTQPLLTKTYDGETYQLDKNDARYTIPFPDDATINNPNL